jgi:indole-3-glycerol phosphate synthase
MILDRILESKRAEVAAAKARTPLSALRGRELWGEGRRGFAHAIATTRGRCVVAEIKKASPSRGVIREDFEPAAHARAYERGGASCISVLTDGPFFQGSLAHLEQARRACSRPLLRKDFVIDAYQIAEARAHGADAVLLIVAALAPGMLAPLIGAARDEGLDILTEVHDENEIETALAAGATLIGVNNRNLRTFETSSAVTRRLITRVPRDVPVISESGIAEASEMAELEALGVRGFLIGEALMAASDPGAALARLLGERQ